MFVCLFVNFDTIMGKEIEITVYQTLSAIHILEEIELHEHFEFSQLNSIVPFSEPLFRAIRDELLQGSMVQ